MLQPLPSRQEELHLIDLAIQEGKLHRITYDMCNPQKLLRYKKTALSTLEDLITSLNEL